MKSHSEPILLAIDTANSHCSVAIGNAKQIVAAQQITDAFQHAEMLTVLIEEVLRQAAYSIQKLDGVVVSAGPGSYTGLRIGASVAKGLCFGSNLPLIAVGTLQMMAQGYKANQPLATHQLLIPTIDARRDEVFVAVYDASLEEVLAPQPMRLDHASLAAYVGPNAIVFGSGADKFSQLVAPSPTIYDPQAYDHAQYLLPLAEKKWQAKMFENTAYFKPDYRKAFYTTLKIGGL